MTTTTTTTATATTIKVIQTQKKNSNFCSIVRHEEASLFNKLSKNVQDYYLSQRNEEGAENLLAMASAINTYGITNVASSIIYV